MSIAALLRQVKKRLAKLTRSRRRSSAGNPSFETLALAGSVADRYKRLQRKTLHFVTDYLEKVRQGPSSRERREMRVGAAGGHLL